MYHDLQYPARSVLLNLLHIWREAIPITKMLTERSQDTFSFCFNPKIVINPFF